MPPIIPPPVGELRQGDSCETFCSFFKLFVLCYFLSRPFHFTSSNRDLRNTQLCRIQSSWDPDKPAACDSRPRVFARTAAGQVVDLVETSQADPSTPFIRTPPEGSDSRVMNGGRRTEPSLPSLPAPEEIFLSPGSKFPFLFGSSPRLALAAPSLG